jgi:predicted O-linked N-acetylglucosamine transferase (SPINDLY family)
MAGVPVVTTTGTRNAENMGASICKAANLTETICGTSEEYIQCAVKLATTPEKLSVVKQKLIEKKETLPLFDIEKFAHNLEIKFKEIMLR